METTLFQILLLLFGFFFGGNLPLFLIDYSLTYKLIFVISIVSIFETFFIENFEKKIPTKIEKNIQYQLLYSKKNSKVFFLFIKFFKNLFDKYELKIKNLNQFIKFGFFWGVFVDGLKLGS